MGDSRRLRRPFDELCLIDLPEHQRQAEDAHERAVAEGVHGPGLIRRDAVPKARQGSRGGIADVEDGASGCICAGVLPVERTSGLVGRVEAGAQQRVEQRQHQRAVVAPGARWLAVAAAPVPGHLADGLGSLELVGHPEGVAHEMSEDGALQALRQQHPARVPRYSSAWRRAVRHGVRRSLSRKMPRSDGRDSAICPLRDASALDPLRATSQTVLGTWPRRRQVAPKNRWNPSEVWPYQSGQLTRAVMPFAWQSSWACFE